MRQKKRSRVDDSGDMSLVKKVLASFFASFCFLLVFYSLLAIAVNAVDINRTVVMVLSYLGFSVFIILFTYILGRFIKRKPLVQAFIIFLVIYGVYFILQIILKESVFDGYNYIMPLIVLISSFIGSISGGGKV